MAIPKGETTVTRTYQTGTSECEGDCGRRLRSSRKTAKEYPGTVTRYSNNMCQKCFTLHGAPKATVVRTQIRPCKNCDHPTRPQALTSKDAPGTLKRIGELCQRCHTHCEFVPMEVGAVSESLEAYLRARRARGVPPEGRGHLGLAA